MNLENQVCSFEQAQSLHGFGIPQVSMFYYDTHSKYEGKEYSFAYEGANNDSGMDAGYYSAFTVSELAEMLPCESGIIGWECWYSDHIGAWYCTIRDLVKWKGGNTIPPVAYESEEDTMAMALADALIHCIENKLVEPQPMTPTDELTSKQIERMNEQ